MTDRQDDRPSMTVIVPVRDDARRLERCLASVRANGYKGPIQIIVADNGSCDDSARVARDAGATVLSLPHLRVAELRNAAAAAATGDMLAFIDADHVVEEGWFSAAVEAMRDPGIAAAGAPCHPPPAFNWVQRSYDRFRPHKRGVHDVEWLGSGNLAVRRDAFVEVHGFDGSLEACEDVDLCNRLRAAGYRLVSDDRMRSVHFGDPATLKALFFGELWRGRDNVRATVRGPLTPRSLPSLIVPVATLLLIATTLLGVASAPWFGPRLPLLAAAGFAILAIARGIQMTSNAGRATMGEFIPNVAVAATYNTARALALVVRAPHRRRRAAAAGPGSAH